MRPLKLTNILYHIVPSPLLNSYFTAEKMKLRIQKLTGETQEVEAEPQNSILDLKVMRVNTTVNMRESRSIQRLNGSRVSFSVEVEFEFTT